MEVDGEPAYTTEFDSDKSVGNGCFLGLCTRRIAYKSL